LGRDLHDDIGQKLVALQLHLDLHRQNLDDKYPELAGECRQISDVVGGLADDLRHVIVALRPPLLDDLGLLPALEAHLADLRRFCPVLEVQLIASGMGGRLPVELETVLFRVCQEALNNVIRHARAQRAQIRLTSSYPAIILIVEDDGIGFQMAPPAAGNAGEHHYGLSGIRERVAAVGGWLKVQSAPGKGTRLRVEVPLTVGR
jgi:signal transduction histidine kinase